VKVSRLIGLFALLLAGMWVALVNGQPLFHPDTSAYVRGPDFAVVYFFGNRFATSWTQKRTLEGPRTTSSNTSDSAAQGSPINSPFDQSVLSGRSIYYGALLYLGHVASKLWLPVFVQAAVFIYLTYTLAVTCLRFPFPAFLGLDVAVIILTPVSFFVSYLMPDIFASFLILGTIILFGFWDELKNADRIIVSAIVLYSATTHSSDLLLLVALVGVAFVTTFLSNRGAPSTSRSSAAVVVLAVLVLCGILAEVAFTYATRTAVGANPIRPPFLMARLIADGPGYRFLQENCSNRPYTVCQFIDRLPEVAPAFLWSTDPKDGVFSVADPSTRRELSSEQVKFALDVFRSDPWGVIMSMGKNALQASFNIGIDEVFLTQQRLQWAKGSLPVVYSDQLPLARIAVSDWQSSWLRSPVMILYLAVYLISFVGLVLSLLLWPSIRVLTKSTAFPEREWFRAVVIATTAVVLNAAICGALSEPIVMRYQTRIAWIPVFAFLLMAASLWASLARRQDVSQFALPVSPGREK